MSRQPPPNALRAKGVEKKKNKKKRNGSEHDLSYALFENSCAFILSCPIKT
jgi:hypothetical protein